jgi:hypothetical protein
MQKNNGDMWSNAECPNLLAVSFRSPPGRWMTYDLAKSEVVADRDWAIFDDKTLFFRQSPLGAQPDLLIDFSRRTAVGLVFEITDPSTEVPRLKRMIAHLDSRAIRMSEDGVAVEGRPPRRNVYYDNPSLEVLWADSDDYEVVLGQFHYGMWAFLYETSTPAILADVSDWSIPVGLITSLDDIHYPIEMSRKGFRDLDVRFV